MRIQVLLDTNEIPIGYRMMIVSLVKEALRRGNEDYFNTLYKLDERKMKPFSFAPYLQNLQMKDDMINLEGLNITFSSPDPEFILYLYNGLLQIEDFKYQNYTIKQKKINPVQEKIIRSNKVVFRTLSPILIEDEKSNPLSPDESTYGKHFNYFADLILKSYRGIGLKKELVLKMGKMRKQVIKENYTGFDNVDNKKDWLYFTGYKGILQLEGDPIDLQLLYQLGISKRRGQGFGFLELEKEVV